MAEKCGRGRAPARKVEDEEVVLLDDPPLDPLVSELQLARTRLRQRWELASVLNFLHVFEPLMQSGLKMSGEEIEEALIRPNEALARLHVAILKGIPPVSKKLMGRDEWVTIACKKLSTWWPWVAEGDNPLKPDRGKEIMKYKELDAISRLLILKALCEVRAEQDDILKHINTALKEGAKISTFRKEKIGGDNKGITYWYDGDPVIGHRLYRETFRTEPKQRLKGKGSSIRPLMDSQWETLATDLEEFREISENLSLCKVKAEVAVGQILKTNIMPVVEEFQKKKERGLKRRQREALLLDDLLHANGIALRCARRERRPVKYTFDDYDRTIDEAIQISKKSKISGLDKMNGKKVDALSCRNVVANDGLPQGKENSILGKVHRRQPETDGEGEGQGSDGEDDDDKETHVNCSDENDNAKDENDSFSNYEMENGGHNHKDGTRKLVLRLLPRGRTNGNANEGDSNAHDRDTTGPAEMKKRLRQRPIRNVGCAIRAVPDSDSDSMPESNKQAEIVSDTGGESSASSSDKN